MTFQIQHTQGEYKVVLTAQQMEALQLTEGAEVDIVPHTNGKAPVRRFATMEEVEQSHRTTEPLYAGVYRELAK